MSVVGGEGVVEVDADRRGGRRVPVSPIVEMVLLGGPEQVHLRVQMLDRGPGGMAFRSPQIFRRGESMAVKLCLPDGRRNLVLCRACSCRPMRGGFHRVGVKFIDKVPLAGDTLKVPAKWV